MNFRFANSRATIPQASSLFNFRFRTGRSPRCGAIDHEDYITPHTASERYFIINLYNISRAHQLELLSALERCVPIYCRSRFGKRNLAISRKGNLVRRETHPDRPVGSDDSSSRGATCDDLRTHCALTSKSPDAAIVASPQQCQPVCHRQPRSRPLFLKRSRIIARESLRREKLLGIETKIVNLARP